MTFALPDEFERLSTALRQEPATAEMADFIATELGRFRHQWTTLHKLRGTDLPLPVPRNQALHPVGCELHAAFLDFQFEWKEGEALPWRAEYQVRVEGLLEAGNTLFELQDHWRLDTDMYAPCRSQRQEKSNPSKEPHPLFHFQRGGRAQDMFAAAEFLPGNPCLVQGQWRALMQTAGPRVPVLPLDPLMAIDFCLSQNDGIIWRKLRNIPEYFDLIERAQKRIWLPFFDAIQDTKFRKMWLGPTILV